MDHSTTAITISPNKGARNVSLICLAMACIFQMAGIDAKYPRTPMNMIILILAAAMILNWTEYSFHETGFRFTRCGLIRRSISWDDVERIVETVYDEGTSSSQHVLLIILKSASKSKYFCKGDSVDAYILSNLRSAYKVSFGGNYETKRALYAHIHEYWGEIEQ